MDEENRPLVLTSTEAFLAVKTLTDAAQRAWALGPTNAGWRPDDAPDKNLRERFDLALFHEGQECVISLTLRDCWTLMLWLDVTAMIGGQPVGMVLRAKLTKLRLEFVADIGFEVPEPTYPIKNDIVATLTMAQPWEKHPRDHKGRFRRRQ